MTILQPSFDIPVGNDSFNELLIVQKGVFISLML